MALPYSQLVRPGSLTGKSNGRLPTSILRTTPGQAGGAPITLLVPAARAWVALTDAAKKAGHTLKANASSSSYRTYAEQEAIFRARYRTTYKAGVQSVMWNGVRWYHWSGATAAVPGTSNHGWALAVDTGEERDGDAGAEPFDSGTLNWLVANEQRFGFSHEIQSEPWHIRYFAGDKIPQAVLDYEAAQNPAPPAPPGDDDDMAVQPYSFWKFDDSPKVYCVAADMQGAYHIAGPPQFSVLKDLLVLGGFNAEVHVAKRGDRFGVWLAEVIANGA